MASALKINYRLTLIFPFLFSSFTPATIHTAALCARKESSPLKTLTYNRLCLGRLFSLKWPRRKLCPESFPSGRSDVENSGEMSWNVCPINKVKGKQNVKKKNTLHTNKTMVKRHDGIRISQLLLIFTGLRRAPGWSCMF